MGRRYRYRKIRKFKFTGAINSKTPDGMHAIVKLDKPFSFGGKEYRLAVINDRTTGRQMLINCDLYRIGDRVDGVAVRGVDALLAVRVNPIDFEPIREPEPTKKPWWKWPWW